MFKKIQSWAKKLKNDVLVLWFALKSPNIPLIAKLIGIFTVAYALSPIDLIPDFIPILGYLDDLILVPILVLITIKLIPNDVITESQQKAQQWIEGKNNKPKSYLGLLLILSIWILFCFYVVSLFLYP